MGKVKLYYLMRWFELKGLNYVSNMLRRLNIIINGVDISPKTEIGYNLKIHHGVGLVIGGAVKIGNNFTVFHNVTIGTGSLRLIEEGVQNRSPTIGDNVTIYPCSVVIGPIKIGDGAVIGAHCVVAKDLPQGKMLSAGSVWK
ncbi:MAG: serine acetyltransferase [Methanobacteriota archaeon]|nr:MAG: serine acetyltransferase [Euryarchaeota archaeon]